MVAVAVADVAEEDSFFEDSSLVVGSGVISMEPVEDPLRPMSATM